MSGQHHAPAALPPEKNFDTHWIWSWILPHSHSGRFR